MLPHCSLAATRESHRLRSLEPLHGSSEALTSRVVELTHRALTQIDSNHPTRPLDPDELLQPNLTSTRKPMQSRRMLRLALSACTAMALVPLLPSFVSAQLSPAPQNHRVLDGGECVSPDLAPDDFCAAVVSYPIPSGLLQESGLVPPVKEGREIPQALRENRLDLLSNRAQAEFEMLLGHHIAATNLRADSPGGVRHTAAAKGLDPASVELPDSRACEDTLRRYVCQNQFPRCVDDERYTEPGQPIELHTCYSLCHDVRNTCALAHRLDCAGHHHKLNPLWEQPSEHALRFDPQYSDGQDPYAQFWMVDCIDAPPNSWKHLTHYLLYGGPAKWTLFTIAAMILYSLIAALMGFNTESQTAVLLKLRAERRAKRAAFDAKMRRFQKKYVRLQEIKTIMLDAQAKEMKDNPAAAEAAAAVGQEVAASASSSSSSPIPASPASAFSPRTPSSIASAAAGLSLRDRALKLAQLDELLASLERDIDVAYRAMTSERLEEVRADYAAGRVPATVGEPEIRAYVAGTTDALSLGSLGGRAATEEEQEALNEEQEMLLRASADAEEDDADLDLAGAASGAAMALSPASSSSLPSRRSSSHLAGSPSSSSRFEAHSTPMDGEEEGYEEVKQSTQRRR